MEGIRHEGDSEVRVVVRNTEVEPVPYQEGDYWGTGAKFYGATLSETKTRFVWLFFFF